MGALGYLLLEEGEELLRRQRDDAVVALHGVRLPTCFSPWEGTFIPKSRLAIPRIFRQTWQNWKILATFWKKCVLIMFCYFPYCTPRSGLRGPICIMRA